MLQLIPSLLNVSCGLYYEHMTIINDDSSVVIKWSSKLIDAAWGIIYDRHMLIIQATELGSSNDGEIHYRNKLMCLHS
jgi:hypothetical protein